MSRLHVLLPLLLLGLSLALPLTQAVDNLPLDADCGNQDTCAPQLVCTQNRCHNATFFGEVPNGLHNSCNETDCCPGDLVCATEGPICVPDSSLFRVYLCGGGIREPSINNDTDPNPPPPPPQDNTTDPNPPPPQDNTTDPNPPRGIAEDQSCDNGELCAAGLRCVQNRCSRRLEVPNGWGNQCTAQNCCAEGQTCMRAGNVCTPTVPGIPAVDCATSQPPALDDILDDGQSGAAALQTSGLMLIALAALALVSI